MKQAAKSAPGKEAYRRNDEVDGRRRDCYARGEELQQRRAGREPEFLQRSSRGPVSRRAGPCCAFWQTVFPTKLAAAHDLCSEMTGVVPTRILSGGLGAALELEAELQGGWGLPCLDDFTLANWCARCVCYACCDRCCCCRCRHDCTLANWCACCARCACCACCCWCCVHS